MAKKKKKFYVVWKGHKRGIYGSWEDCKRQIDGFQGAQYKSFESEKEAIDAFSKSYAHSITKGGQKKKAQVNPNAKPPTKNSIVVDAAWNTRTGDMEYQGFDFNSGKLLFKKGPFKDGTNNVGEFLAIVHALALLKNHGVDLPIYSDSRTAMSWVRKKKANTKLEKTEHNQELFELIDRAEKWLEQNTYKNIILKWDTKNWGENPADFGRK
ncbi:ribonuclease H1 domain-containing protein [Jiulongibacter sp. NS-SX5]|uniref:ribonuclease H1 domain-containing protein n=1 Tax=Jiulongibacter sp. NS-SX5 TaxID=3463854 RepID=UPI0040586BC2